jgi:MFS family permease
MATFQLLVGPILTLYLLNKGLSFTEIMVLQSIYSIAVFLLEVPTGAVSDLIGRKISLIFAGISMTLGALAYITGSHLIQFAVGETLFACGMSLKSGSDTSLVYDSLKKLDNTKDFANIQGKGESFALTTQILGSVVSGFIYKLNPEFPLMLSMLMMMISSVSALFFFDIKTYEHEKKPGYIKQITLSGKYLAGHKRVRAIVIYSVFFFVFYRIGFWFYQPYFQAVKIEAGYFGILFAIFNLVAAVSARFSDVFIKLTKGKSMITLSVLLALSFLLMGITRSWPGFIFICLQQITRGVNVPVFMKYINKHIPSNQRATIISFSSLLKNIAAAAAFPVVGYAMDRLDAISINLYSGFIMAVGIVFFYCYLNRTVGKNAA